MVNKEYQSSETHFQKHIVKPIEIGPWEMGTCFICKSKAGMIPDGYCHYQCAIAYEAEKKKILDSFLKKDNQK